MEGPFPIDLWQSTIAPHLDVRSLCALMACSRRSFFVWSSELAWCHQRARICAVHPELGPLFDLHGWVTAKERGQRLNEHAVELNDDNDNKRRKTPWQMPTHGTWFVFKHILLLGCTMHDFTELCQRAVATLPREYDKLAFAIVRTHVPHGERLKEFFISGPVKGLKRLFNIDGFVGTQGESHVEVDVYGDDENDGGGSRDGSVRVSFWDYRIDNDSPVVCRQLYTVDGTERAKSPNWWFDGWRCFLLDLPLHPYWTPEFEARMAAH